MSKISRPDNDRVEAAREVATMSAKINEIATDVAIIRAELENKYITRFEFDPIKKIVYGVVSMILVAVMSAMIALVIIRQ